MGRIGRQFRQRRSHPLSGFARPGPFTGAVASNAVSQHVCTDHDSHSQHAHRRIRPQPGKTQPPGRSHTRRPRGSAGTPWAAPGDEGMIAGPRDASAAVFKASDRSKRWHNRGDGIMQRWRSFGAAASGRRGGVTETRAACRPSAGQGVSRPGVPPSRQQRPDSGHAAQNAGRLQHTVLPAPAAMRGPSL